MTLRSYRQAEEENGIQRRSSACSQQPPCRCPHRSACGTLVLPINVIVGWLAVSSVWNSKLVSTTDGGPTACNAAHAVM